MKGVRIALVSLTVGCALGVAGTAYIISSGGTFVRKETAERQAEQASVIRLLPYCVAMARADPNRYQVLLDLKVASAQEKPVVLAKTGWATPLGDSAPDDQLAIACVKAVAP